jgi:glycogen operon protein
VSGVIETTLPEGSARRLLHRSGRDLRHHVWVVGGESGQHVPADGRRADDGGFDVAIHTSGIRAVQARVDDGPRIALEREQRTGDWIGRVPTGSRYVVAVDGDRLALDPRATEVWFPPGHSRDANKRHGGVDPADFPRAVAAPWPTRRPQRHTTRPLVVYEAHVRGLTARRDRPDAGTFRAAIDELPRLARLGVSVLELLPVHQYDPDEGNYWGYMPLVFGAVHRQYAAGDRPAEELADLVTAAHDHDIEVWLDVVFNHTTEADRAGPYYSLRVLDEREYYVVGPDGTYLDDAGTGNTIDAHSPQARRLIMEALDRFADLGVDGFRFDLAAVLARDTDFVRAIGDWSERRGVRLVAEPWDMARYLLGPDFPDQRWMQWNGEFRDEVRGFLRGDPGMVPSMVQRLAGSPDLFTSPMCSLNFLTAHDGFTMYDLVAYDHRHNEANGWDNTDGHHDNRSWNCGWEGDVGAPDDVMVTRRRQLRNAVCLLALSHGVPMFVAGDEFARTQGGNNNAYNQDNETSWLDWQRASEWSDHERFVRDVLAVRAAHPVLWDPERWGARLTTFGANGDPDLDHESRSIAWAVDGLYVMANMWWEPVEFTVQVPGDWRVVIDTNHEVTGDSLPHAAAGETVTVGPRSIIVLSL